jgi:hypothetical protein
MTEAWSAVGVMLAAYEIALACSTIVDRAVTGHSAFV